jgi:Probable sensor domain DACNV
MLEGKSSPTGSGHAAPGYSYPGDLARFVRDRWRDAPEPLGRVDPLLDSAVLEGFFAACYQASMLREEERPVIFRAILAEPALFDPEGRPPESLQRLTFPRSLPFDPRELRRLSAAADPQRTLIGVRQDGEGTLRIWGLINSGTRWLRDIQGGRRAGAPLPPVPVVHVDAPGSIEAYKGHELVGKLQGGRLSGSRADPFESEWLPGQFSGFLEELVQRHKAARNRARERSGERWAPLDPTLPLRIAERMMKRVISVLRDARHGGTVLFVTSGSAKEPSREHPYIDLRYPFEDGPARLSFPDLIVDILNRLAQLYGTADHEQEPGAVGWEDFEETTDAEIESLDEALFETAHLIAGLAAADGAVVMSKQNELLGFGGMISGRLPDVERVWRALDLEGKVVAEERTGNVGSRHRSAYRLASALPGSVAVVVSQDGGVRFVCQRGGRVTYWEQE